ncbi:hypothetical protein TeGR_g6765 [Tetraparma gracilis]|uniref:Uncharacterized protein n=1 Tax=Tetraparma gracilis TaxID=2962635 RepID=A0ABQ6NAQ6_9STRA|nr:hypothetical protein TeGR_g6765 [Tetraparma gracilis]
MSYATSARGSTRESMRRLSMDAGIALGALRPEDLPPSSQVQVLDEELANANAGGDVIASDVYNPVSLLFHTLRSNADGLTGAAPSLVIILGSKLLVDWAIKKGVDPHLAHCAMCMTMTEMIAALLNYESPGYIRKRLLIGVPCQIGFALLFAWLAFDMRPGLWTSAMLTVTFWGSMLACWPLESEETHRQGFLAHVKSTFIMSQLHTSIVGFIHVQVIPTRMLAESDSAVLTVLVTGAIFPFLAFLVRKFLMTVAKKQADGARDMNAQQRMKLYGRCVKSFSAAVLMTPTVLLYFNKSYKLALTSALMQVITEVGAKIWVVHVTKVQFRAYMDQVRGEQRGVFGKTKVAVLRASQEPGVNKDVDDASVSLLRKENAALRKEVSTEKEKNAKLTAKGGVHELESEVGVDYETRLKHTLAMLAVRWNAEIIAEKGCIITGALIAALYFEDMVDSTTLGLALIGAIFFAVEVGTDVTFVHIMDAYYSVPMLSAVPHEPVLTSENFITSILLALGFNGMCQCIGMASMVDLS